MRCELELARLAKARVFRALDRRVASNLLTASTVKLPAERRAACPNARVVDRAKPCPQPCPRLCLSYLIAGHQRQRKALQTNWSKLRHGPHEIANGGVEVAI